MRVKPSRLLRLLRLSSPQEAGVSPTPGYVRRARWVFQVACHPLLRSSCGGSSTVQPAAQAMFSSAEPADTGTARCRNLRPLLTEFVTGGLLRRENARLYGLVPKGRSLRNPFHTPSLRGSELRAHRIAELGGDLGAIRTLYRQAAEELPRQIYALREAIKDGRTSTVRSWSRLLAITLGHLLATVAAEAAYDLHRASRSGSDSDIERAMEPSRSTQTGSWGE